MIPLPSQPSQSIYLPGGPAIPGLHFRNFQGESDFPGMQTVLNAARVADQEQYFESLEGFINNITHLTHCDPYQDILIAEIHAEVVAFSRVEWRVEEATGAHLYMLIGWVRPDWRGRGIGRAMLHHNQVRLHEIAVSLSSAGDERPGEYEAYATNFQPGNLALMESEGYHVVRQGYTMYRPNLDEIPEIPMPEGLEVRPALPEHYRKIWDASQEAFRDHWGYAVPTEEDYQGWLKSSEFQPDLWQVAWDGEEVAGMILNFINQEVNEKFGRKRGYTEGISVRRPWRKRGLARALLARSLKMHRDLGMTEAGLGVDASNPHGAVHLYELMGYRTARTTFTYRKPIK